MNKNIIVNNGVFMLSTGNTSMLFRKDQFGHLEHIHYGSRVMIEDAEFLAVRHDADFGEAIDYDEQTGYGLDNRMFEWSGNGRGDFRESPLEIESDEGTTTDFLFEGYEIAEGSVTIGNGLPSAYGEDETLIIHMKDAGRSLRLDLIYGVSVEDNTITRRAVLMNDGEDITIRKIMNFSMDIAEEDLVMMTFNGGWSNEVHRTDRSVEKGRMVSSSSTGFSSSRANPGFILRKQNTDEDHGRAWGFNQIYTGNHYASVSCDEHQNVRVMCGINPERFSWTLRKGESFFTPQTFMTYSDEGLNGMSANFHRFINGHIVRGEWKDKERPILVNDWEAFMFSFTEDSIVSLAEQGKKLGAELFVLDDGWFGARNHDRAGLGDYNPIKEKLPNGIRGLSDRIHDLDMMFGLWFEPEAVNPDSDLYRAHPEWAIHDHCYKDIYGRHEMLLNLTLPEVRDYIVENVGRTLDEGNVDYVKWDMNRHMVGEDGAFDYRYILGLYEVLERVFGPRPHILFESCSSGGNRFDAGMMCFSPQIWTSDDTDAIERLDIQKGASYLYPQSTMGAHVSAIPNAQTMREVPLTTRFAVSAFGLLGYELDLTILTETEKKEIAEQIKWYKEHRKTLQYGQFVRGMTDAAHESFAVVSDDQNTAVSGVFRRVLRAASGYEKMRVPGLDHSSAYTAVSRHAVLPIASGSHLYQAAKMAGTLCEEEDGSCGAVLPAMHMKCSGSALNYGIQLNTVYNGSGYNKDIRVPQDFGAELFFIEKERK